MGCTRQLSHESFDRRSGHGRAESALRLLAVLAVATLWLSGGGASAASAASYGPVAWGDNSYGQLGNGEFEGFRIAPVAVGKLGDEIRVGDEVAVGEESTALAAGYRHGLALLRNGKVMAWGENGDGQLGDGTSLGPETCVFSLRMQHGPGGSERTSTKPQPSQPATTSAWPTEHGKVMAWGDGGNGQLGDGQRIHKRRPGASDGIGRSQGHRRRRPHSLAC